MPKNKFVWSDLSTFDMPSARADYAALFGWAFDGSEDYDFAMIGASQMAAVFPMPTRLADIGMPSFWMSYVMVADLDATVAKVRQHPGVVIEVEPEAFSSDARIALVRDPSGAGFTLYEGPEISPAASTGSSEGAVLARFHHSPDIGLISAFYEDLFGWRFVQRAAEPWPVYDILHADGSVVAQAEEVPEAVRGKFRYWMPCFAVASVAETRSRLENRDGQVSFDLGDGRLVVHDRQGGHFMIRQGETNAAMKGATAKEPAAARDAPWPWKALAGLVAVWIAVVLEIDAFWGVLFLLWTWPAIRTGRADFIEPVFRESQPLLYWGLATTWVALSLWMILASLATLGIM